MIVTTIRRVRLVVLVRTGKTRRGRLEVLAQVLTGGRLWSTARGSISCRDRADSITTHPMAIGTRVMVGGTRRRAAGSIVMTIRPARLVDAERIGKTHPDCAAGQGHRRTVTAAAVDHTCARPWLSFSSFSSSFSGRAFPPAWRHPRNKDPSVFCPRRCQPASAPRTDPGPTQACDCSA